MSAINLAKVKYILHTVQLPESFEMQSLPEREERTFLKLPTSLTCISVAKRQSSSARN